MVRKTNEFEEADFWKKMGQHYSISLNSL